MPVTTTRACPQCSADLTERVGVVALERLFQCPVCGARLSPEEEVVGEPIDLAQIPEALRGQVDDMGMYVPPSEAAAPAVAPARMPGRGGPSDTASGDALHIRDLLDETGKKSFLIGAGIGLVFSFVPILGFLLQYLAVLLHEFGHAAAFLLFGYVSIPSFDFVHGGGVTLPILRPRLLVLAPLVGYAYLGWHWRHFPKVFVPLSLVALLHALLTFSDWHYTVVAFMGHGTEMIFVGIFYYRALTGASINNPMDRLDDGPSVERVLYAVSGTVVLLMNLKMFYRVLFDSEWRRWYEAGKSGMANDFTAVADRLDVDLNMIATPFVVLALLVPAVTWLFVLNKPLLLAKWAKLFD
jgi:hypothetical protein